MSRDCELRKAVQETVSNIAPVLARSDDTEREHLLFLMLYTQLKIFDETNLLNENALLRISELIAPENVLLTKDILRELKDKTNGINFIST